MISLVGFSWLNVLLGVLYVSAAVLVLVIAYRKLLRVLGKGAPVKADYMILYTVERNSESKELSFYFTTDVEKEYKLELLNAEMEPLRVISEGIATMGGNIVRLAAQDLESQAKYYRLLTDNQKTTKKF